jgi:hypothetical protein
MILSLGACAVGRRHTSDAALERVFETHESEFEALLAEFEANPRLMGLSAGDRVDFHEGNLRAMELAGLPRESATYFEDRLRRLGLRCVTKGGYGVEFEVDPGSISNGDSYKGLWWYREGEPRDVRPSLDSYRFSNTDQIVYKALKGRWYLYIFVSH